jgi:hypothetical protein
MNEPVSVWYLNARGIMVPLNRSGTNDWFLISGYSLQFGRHGVVQSLVLEHSNVVM